MAKTEKRSFVLYHDIRKPLEMLSDEQRGELFLAILNYSEFNIMPDFEDSVLSMAFAFIQNFMDRDAAAWRETREKRAIAGSKGGKQKVANLANATFAKQNKQNLANQADNVSVSVSDNVSVNVSESVKEKKRPPTLDEVKVYCQERNSPVDPVQFYEYFTEGGWKDAKGNSVKNWKQKLLTWEKFDREKFGRSPSKIAGQNCNDGTAKLDLTDLDELAAFYGVKSE